MSRKAILILLAAILAAVGVSSALRHAGVPTAQERRAKDGELQVLPAEAYASSELNARVALPRGRSAPVDSCTWFRNGRPVPGVHDGTLAPSYFVKGDRIEVEAVTAPGAPAKRSQPVLIRNSRPQIRSAMASQREDGAELYLQMTAGDNDGDALTYSYAWFRNGAAVEGAAGATLDATGFKDGDKVYARITASDGQDSAAPFNSSPIVLGSDALAITSTPPATTSGGHYLYQVTTTEHEPGSLSYQLTRAPAGMTIDGNGHVDWTLPQDQEQVVVHEVTVRVTHRTGSEATQSFSITTGPVTQQAAAN